MLTEKRLDELKDALQKRADEMGNLAGDVRSLKMELGEFEQTKKEVENELVLEISFERDENDKPKYTNENSRKAELSARLKKNQPYQKLLDEQKKTESDLLNKEIDLGRVEMKYDALKTIKDLVVAELNLKADLHRDFDRE